MGVRLSSSGQMYLQTRTEKSVIPFICAFFTAHLRQKNYLGHSINAPTGRWQKNKDIHWYNRDVDASAAERAEEIRKVKEAEADALAVALYVRSWFLFPSLIKLYTRGFAPAPKAVAPPGSDASPSGSTTIKDKTSTTLEKEEKRRRKAERKEEKRAKKEKRRMERGEDGGRRAVEDDYSHRRRRDHSRSRSHYGETLNVLRPAATTLGVPEVRYPYEIGSVSILNTTPGTMNVREKEVLQDGIPGLEEDLQALLRVIVNVVNAFD